MKKSLIIFLMILILNSCVVTPIVSGYRTEQISSAKKTNLTVQILPFKDGRQEGNYSHSFSCFILTLLPLWPYCTKYYNADAGQTDFNRFLKTMQNALAKDLRRNEIFADVSTDQSKRADIYIQTTVNEYSLIKKASNWGLSVITYYVGIYGIPMGWARNNADITYTVTNSTGKVLFEKTYQHHETRVHGYYYPSIVGLGSSYKPINNQFFNDLMDVLAKVPNVKFEKNQQNIGNSISDTNTYSDSFDYSNDAKDAYLDLDYSDYE